MASAALDALPTETAMREAAAWSEDKETELAGLTAILARDPAAQAAARRRAAATLSALADTLDAVGTTLADTAIDELQARMGNAAAAAAAAATSAERRFAGEPIPRTGQGTWERMYAFARQFAAETGVRAADEPFQAGDPCPVCQRGLDQDAAERLGRFDQFVQDAAAAEAAAASAALEFCVETIRTLPIPVVAEVERNLAEYRDFGEDEARLGVAASAFAASAAVRRAAALAGAAAGRLGDIDSLPASPAGLLRAEATRLCEAAAGLEIQPTHDAALLTRAAELADAKRLAGGLEAVLARRCDLELRQRLLNCRVALDTGPISRFGARRRRELVTPDLRARIVAEIGRLDLGHVPMRFEEATDHGRNLFDMALDSRQQAMKSRILSEGEQRALGIACFLAEMGRIPGRHGIIVDDPVSSLDHQRVRKVAERLVEEAAGGRQVIIFTHHLIFYQEVLAAAAARMPQVPVLVNLINKADGRFGLISENDEPWIAKKVIRRIEALRARFNAIPAAIDPGSEAYRRLAKDFYTDLRETWERLVEEVLLNGVVERFCSGIKTQSLKEVLVDDSDYQTIFAAMKRVSEYSGHDMAPGRQIPVPDRQEMGRDLEAIERYRAEINRRKEALRARRRGLEDPPVAAVE
jgi:hypothetical protein